jgi:hypothetical protein
MLHVVGGQNLAAIGLPKTYEHLIFSLLNH